MISCNVSFVYDGCSHFHGYILLDWNSKLLILENLFWLKRKEGKRNESTLHLKCLVYKGERKGKKNPHALVQILSSLYFLPIWEKRKMLALWRTLHFPFPRSISLQTNKRIFFSFLPLPSLTFPPASLQPPTHTHTHTHTYILIIFLPIMFINHYIEYGVVWELAKPLFIF